MYYQLLSWILLTISTLVHEQYIKLYYYYLYYEPDLYDYSLIVKYLEFIHIAIKVLTINDRMYHGYIYIHKH
jgi:hypothetical protein